MNIEDIEEDADPGCVQRRNRLDADHLAVGGGNGYGSAGDLAIRIAEEISAKRSEEKERNRKRRMREVSDRNASGREPHGIVDAVNNHFTHCRIGSFPLDNKPQFRTGSLGWYLRFFQPMSDR